MRRVRELLSIGLMSAVLAGPASADPAVTVLGSEEGADPLVQCGDLAASPFEPGRNGRGLNDEQIFLDGALATCEAALAANPDSHEAQTWLARVYNLEGRREEAIPLAQTASDAGNPFASYLLAKWLDDTNYLQPAADGGFAPAQSDLADRYATGGGVPGNYEKARALYQSAADQGYGYAAYKLGEFEHYGTLGTADYTKAMEEYQRAAALGEPLGNYGLGQLYEFGQGVEQDYVRAGEYYQLAADAGEKMSQTGLAYFYEQGLGVPQDYDKSFALLVSASAQDYGYAHAALAIHYLFGQGTAVDEAKAFDLAWRAQRLRITYSEGILGYMYQYGLGTVRDLGAALQHYQDGANAGDQYSADQISYVEADMACQDAAGSPYEPGGFGHGKAFADINAEEAIPLCEEVQENQVGNRVWLARAYARAERYQDAVPLLEEGVAAGNVLAHTVLADLLMSGAGVDQDQSRAIALYEAVAKDFGLAQYSLGVAYKEGTGVPQDRDEAMRWLRLAQSFGVTEADAEISDILAEDGGNAVDLAGFGREGPGY